MLMLMLKFKLLKTIIVTGLAMVLVLAEAAGAATDYAVLTISATVQARAKLTLSSPTVTFPDADPDTVPSIPAQEGAITVTAKIRSTSACDLKVLAAGDLKSGANTIDISNVTWTASGGGFQGGTMNKTTAQIAGTWPAGSSGSHAGTFSFFLANSWNYAPGNYTTTATFTLTAP
jgi:hypothetical protein